ncbi:MAG TPA: membrane protein insertion efficiency factor YidD [Gemmataceae bacterium]|nr:membrane protein insertion efficiency factor YidD [Gemmataceae bacterium]
MSALRWLWKAPFWVVSAAMILCVRAYQKLIRPVLPPMCRFEPGCSEYFILAVKKYGPVVGAAKGAWRICRCNPWCQGGYDPP